MKNIVVSWSSGKDSTLTLLRLLDDPDYKVVGLFTTYIKDPSLEGKVPFQETPINLVRLQAGKIQLPLIEIELPDIFPENSVYQHLVVDGLKKSGFAIDAVAFGDIFCNGIVDYRKSYIEPAGWQCVFPLLNQKSFDLADEIINRGIKTFVACVDTTQASGNILGQEYTTEFLRNLPKGVDHCGENGEFHTLVYQAPCFSSSIKIKKLNQNKDGRFYIQNYQFL